jgi:hypothetical protein
VFHVDKITTLRIPANPITWFGDSDHLKSEAA